MYVVIPILLVLCLILALLSLHKKKRIIQKVCEMSYTEKCCLLNELAEPLGFSYQFVQDIFSTSADAWQKAFGYGEFYDQTALDVNMVLDCEPVYFNYQGKTWLIEFWKGQYGINTGAESGIYHADTIIAPALRPQTIFHAASSEELFPVKLRLVGSDCPYFTVNQTSWWSAGYVMGLHSKPEDLILEVKLTFPDSMMCTAFTRAMYGLGYRSSEITVYQTTAEFYFTVPKSAPLFATDTCYRNYVLWKTKKLCNLYLWITRPFCTTVDRLLCLYYYFPFLFGRFLRLRVFKTGFRDKYKRGKK